MCALSHRSRFFGAGPDSFISCWYIAAAQGHTREDMKLSAIAMAIAPDTMPPIVMHLSYTRFVSNIIQRGLRRGGGTGQMNDRAVHCHPCNFDDPTFVAGSRKHCEVAVYLDSDLLREGLEKDYNNLGMFIVASNHINFEKDGPPP